MKTIRVTTLKMKGGHMGAQMLNCSRAQIWWNCGNFKGHGSEKNFF